MQKLKIVQSLLLFPYYKKLLLNWMSEMVGAWMNGQKDGRRKEVNLSVHKYMDTQLPRV